MSTGTTVTDTNDAQYAVLANFNNDWVLEESGISQKEAHELTGKRMGETHGGDFIYGTIDQCNLLIGEQCTETRINFKTGKAQYAEKIDNIPVGVASEVCTGSPEHAWVNAEDILYSVISNVNGVWDLKETGVNKYVAEEKTGELIDASHGGEVVYGIMSQCSLLIGEECTQTRINFQTGKAQIAVPETEATVGFQRTGVPGNVWGNMDGSPSAIGTAAAVTKSQGAAIERTGLTA